MSVLDWLRRPRLVPVAEFTTTDAADAAWAALNEAGIPASVVTDNTALGDPAITRVFVEKPHVAAAQQVIAPLMGG